MYFRLGNADIQVQFHDGIHLYDKYSSLSTYSKASNLKPSIRIDFYNESRGEDSIKAFLKQKPLFASETAWQVVEIADSFHFGPVKECNFDPMLPHVIASKDFTSIQVYTQDQQVGSAYPLDEIIADHYLALNNGIIVHASGLNINGEGVLFLGDSGAGKSTIAEFFVNHYGMDSILCDDRMILRYCDGQWLAFGSPWHGTYNHYTTHGVPLKAMYFIEQSQNGRHAIAPVQASEIFERLTRVSFVCWWQPDFARKQLQTIQSLVMDDNIQSQVLSFSKEPSIVDYLRPSL